MPQRSTSALRYAEAVFQVARDSDTIDAWLSELADVEQLVEDELAARVLLSPVVPRERKLNILNQALSDAGQPVRNFLALLVHRERLGFIPQIAADFRLLVDRHRGVAVAQVTTAAPIEDTERRILVDRLSRRTGKQIRLVEHVDSSLIGGVIAQVGDEIIDGSVRGRLDRMRRTLAGNV